MFENRQIVCIGCIAADFHKEAVKTKVVEMLMTRQFRGHSVYFLCRYSFAVCIDITCDIVGPKLRRFPDRTPAHVSYS